MPAAWRNRLLNALAPAILIAGACGGSGDGAAGNDGGAGGTGGPVVPGTASCTQTQTVEMAGRTLHMKICAEWTGISPQQLEAYRLSCGAGTSGGADAAVRQERLFSQAPCAHEGALGGCAITLAGVTQTGWYYDDDSGFTLEMVQMVCAQAGGTFVAP